MLNGLAYDVRCLLSCKDKNFKANHNTSDNYNHYSSDVCYLAKIRILKQITTELGCSSY